MTYFIEQTVNALSLGGTYALLALGLAVVFSILGMINFAHGALMTLTGYALVFASIVGLPFGLGALDIGSMLPSPGTTNPQHRSGRRRSVTR